MSVLQQIQEFHETKEVDAGNTILYVYTNPKGLSLSEFLSTSLYSSTTGESVCKAKIQEIMDHFVFYYMDQGVLDVLEKARPDFNSSDYALCKQILDQEKDQEKLKQWYIKYGKLYITQVMFNSDFQSFKLRFDTTKFSDLDSKVQSYMNEKIFIKHYDSVVKAAVINQFPSMEKYFKYADNNFKMDFFSYMTSDETILEYSNIFSGIAAYSEDQTNVRLSSVLNDLKFKIDILDPTGKSSNEILNLYVGTSFFSKVSLQGSTQFVKDISKNIIDQILSGIKKDKNNEFYSIYNELTAMYGAKVQSTFVSIAMEFQKVTESHLSEYGYVSFLREENKALIVEAVKKSNIPSKFALNPRFIAMTRGIMICIQGLTLLYGIINYDAYTKDSTFRTALFWTNAFLFFQEVVVAGSRFALRVFANALLSLGKVKNVLTVLSKGLPELMAKVFGPKAVARLGKIIPALCAILIGFFIYDLIKNPPKNGWEIALAIAEGAMSGLTLFACFIPALGPAAVVATILFIFVALGFAIFNLFNAMGNFDTLFNFIGSDYLVADDVYIQRCKDFIASLDEHPEYVDFKYKYIARLKRANIYYVQSFYYVEIQKDLPY